MAVFHYIALRAFAHETEDPARVVTAIRHAAQDAESKLAIDETHVEGSHGNAIRILEAELKNAPSQKRMFAALARDDPRGFESLRSTVRERVDENLNLHLRLDKQEAYIGRVRLARDDDAITVRGKIRNFESKRSGSALEASLPTLEAYLLELSLGGKTVGQ